MYNTPHKGLFVSPLIHVDWMILSQFKSIISQNPSQSIPIHSNAHGIGITKQGLIDLFSRSFFLLYIGGVFSTLNSVSPFSTRDPNRYYILNQIAVKISKISKKINKASGQSYD